MTGLRWCIRTDAMKMSQEHDLYVLAFLLNFRSDGLAGVLLAGNRQSAEQTKHCVD